ncbi:hypothetical protein HPB51_010809 [Rhipicephalus microplus]|uniref:Tick transposon n=1 Tax=Rhipicephalus microplus TaxID=6941 RepID=A0A9J6DM70_RHIMP|nr:hypothetical protein HPB51_010809 [Rhipicephalus microplus]
MTLCPQNGLVPHKMAALYGHKIQDKMVAARLRNVPRRIEGGFPEVGGLPTRVITIKGAATTQPYSRADSRDAPASAVEKDRCPFRRGGLGPVISNTGASHHGPTMSLRDTTLDLIFVRNVVKVKRTNLNVDFSNDHSLLTTALQVRQTRPHKFRVAARHIFRNPRQERSEYQENQDRKHCMAQRSELDKLNRLIRKAIKRYLSLRMYTSPDQMVRLGMHNTLGKIAEAPERARFARLSSTRSGINILQEL